MESRIGLALTVAILVHALVVYATAPRWEFGFYDGMPFGHDTVSGDVYLGLKGGPRTFNIPKKMKEATAVPSAASEP